MTQEEKSKAYDEALERAKDCLADGTITNTAKSYIEAIFPELKTNFKRGDKVKIHCNSSRADSIKRYCDNKIGTVHHVWDLERNPWGNIIVVVNGKYGECRDGFLYEELELLK